MEILGSVERSSPNPRRNTSKDFFFLIVEVETERIQSRYTYPLSKHLSPMKKQVTTAHDCHYCPRAFRGRCLLVGLDEGFRVGFLRHDCFSGERTLTWTGSTTATQAASLFKSVDLTKSAMNLFTDRGLSERGRNRMTPG